MLYAIVARHTEQSAEAHRRATRAPEAGDKLIAAGKLIIGGAFPA